MFPLKRFTVLEDSMLPTLCPGDDALVFKWLKATTGSIVVARVKNKFYIKRLSRIEKDSYYLLGDNSRDSIDSRYFGPIDKKDIVGKVIFISHWSDSML